MTHIVFRKLVAKAAIFLALFSALSPALAALRFQDRPEFMTEICTPAGIKRVVVDDGPAEQKTGRQTHGIYCAWCLAGGQYAITGSSGDSGLFVPAVSEQAFHPVAASYRSNFAASYHSRAPPVSLN